LEGNKNMPVTEFECAIAKSQIGRYIAGDNLGNEVVRQLESHIAACPNCKKLLEEKRTALMQMLDKPGDITAAVNPGAATNPAPVQMTPAVKRDYDFDEEMQPRVTEAPAPVDPEKALKAALREKLAAQMLNAPQPKKNNKQPEMIEVPVVAPAFASKEARNVETVQVMIGEPKAEKPKRSFGLGAFALYKKVRDEEETTDAPALNARTIREAKVAFKTNNPTLRKPMIYAGALAVVVTAMSFVLKDPTSMFGPKAEKNLLVNNKSKTAPKKTPNNKSKVSNKTKKVAMSNPLSGTKGTNAQPFAPTTPAKVSSPVVPAANTAKRELNPTLVMPTKKTAPATKKAETKKVAPNKIEPKKVEAPKSKTAAKTANRKKGFAPQQGTKIPKRVAKKSTTVIPTTTKPKLKKSNPSTGTVRVYDADGNPIK
jgi:hypothetical protein